MTKKDKDVANERENPPKRLYRSRKDKIVGGVCGGIAEYLNIDPVWARLVAVLLLFADGAGLLIYLIAWVLMPENPNQKEGKTTEAEKTVEKIKSAKLGNEGKDTTTILLGILIAAIGSLLLIKNLFPWFSFHYVWPVAIIAAGLYLLLKR